MFNIIATAAKAAAPAANGAAGAQTQTNPMGMLLLMGAAFILMFWMMSRSNKKQQQKREELLNSIVKGTEVMLASGIYGTVSAVQDQIFTVEIADRVFVKVNRAGIHDVIRPEADAKAEEKKEEKKEETADK